METDASLLLRLGFGDDGGDMGVDTSPAGVNSGTAVDVTTNDDVAGGRGANGVFNGTTSYIGVPSQFGNNSSLTVTAWIKPSSLSAENTIFQFSGGALHIWLSALFIYRRWYIGWSHVCNRCKHQ